MKLLKRQVNAKDAGGFIQLEAEDSEDMWQIYNIVAVGDKVRAPTFRRVVQQSDTLQSSSRVRITLTIVVESIDFDAGALTLNVNGRVAVENPHVKLNSYHCITLEPHRAFSVEKEQWDAIALARVDEACDPASRADVAAVVLHEGLAHVCLVTPSMSMTRARIEMSIPKKRMGSTTQHEKAMERFFDAILRAILQHVDFAVIKAVIIAGPGFTKDQLWDWIQLEANRRELRGILENKRKFLLCHANSGHKFALNEVFENPTVVAQLQDTKASAEMKALRAFFDMLSLDPDRAVYGPDHVRAAADKLAVDSLLISDALFRNVDPAVRRSFIALVEQVQDAGGTLHIFSSQHTSGEQLAQLTGIAAVLRFPMPELDGIVEPGDESSSSSSSSSSSEDES